VVERETSPIYVSQEELEEEEARVEELKVEIPRRRREIDARENTIKGLESWQVRERRLISLLSGRVEARAELIREREARRALYLRRSRDRLVSIANREIALRVAGALRRSIRSLRGWQTRQRAQISVLEARVEARAARLRRVQGARAALIRWIRERARELAEEEARLLRKVVRPLLELARVTVSLYLIIEAGSHVYPREEGAYYEYRRPYYRKARHTVKYPKGRFQSILECDCFLDPETGELQTDRDPFMTLEDVMRAEVADEIMEEFSLKSVDSGDLTLGVVSTLAQEDDIGKPPFKVSISRTYEGTGKEWKTVIERFIMTASEYEALTSDMDEYLEALEAMG